MLALLLAATVLLPTGVRLDAAGRSITAGNLPLSMVLAPDGRHAILLLCGWKQEGLQVVDLDSGAITQTIEKPAAFLGLAFSPDGRTLYASGGNSDAIYQYAWRDGQLVDERTISIKHSSGLRYPAGIAPSAGGRYLYVAEQVADMLAVVDLEKGEVVQRLATEHYPYAIAASPKGEVFVSAWGGESISCFRAGADGLLAANGRIRVGRHPSALLLHGTTLFAAMASIDRIAIVDTTKRRVVATLDDHPPGGVREGSTPNALALSPDGKLLFAAEADNNAVAVFKLATKKLVGRIPTDWYPAAVSSTDNRLFILSAKGGGTRPNPGGSTPLQKRSESDFNLGQLDGTIREIRLPLKQLEALTQRVARANHWNETRSTAAFPPFKHVIYIIKENRSYDQVFGDIPEGDGDPSLLFFPREASPNHRALAARFGLLDRFFVNSEVSAQGHLWSTAAYVTDYTEKTTHLLYSERRPDFDEGEVDDPAEGYLWSRALEKGVSLRIYGEFALPDATKTHYLATKKDAKPYTSADYPAFDVNIQDQKRADVWLAELSEFVKRGTMPQLEIVHLPGDHTAGARAGKATPGAYFADNDLALGRMIEALSLTPFWRDTAVFVVEDDAQNGPDHVDSHRSIAFAISPWSRGGVQHQFINTTDVVSAIEQILGLRPMSHYDRYARSLTSLFGTKPDVSPYHALAPSQRLDERNPDNTKAAELSSQLDLSCADCVDDALFNRVLWEWRAGLK